MERYKANVQHGLSTSQFWSVYSTNHKDIGTLNLFRPSKYLVLNHNRMFSGGRTESEQRRVKHDFPTRDSLHFIYQQSVSKNFLKSLNSPYIKGYQLYAYNKEKTSVVEHDELYLFSSSIILSSLNATIENSRVKSEEYFHVGNFSELIANFWVFAFLLLLLELKKSCTQQFFFLLEDILNSSLKKLIFLQGDPSFPFYNSFIVKELYITLLSFLSSPADYYSYGSLKQSTIKDFFDSFLLLNIHIAKLQRNSNLALLTYPCENTLKVSNKKTILFFLNTPRGISCAPCIVKFYTDEGQYKVFFEKGINITLKISDSPYTYNQNDIYNYHHDSLSLLFSDENTRLLDGLPFFFDSNFVLSREDNDGSSCGILHVLHPSAVKGITFGLESLIAFFDNPTKKDHLLFQMLVKKELILPFTSQSPLFSFFSLHTEAYLSFLQEMSTIGTIMKEEPTFSFGKDIPCYYYQYQFLFKRLLNAFKGTQLNEGVIKNDLLQQIRKSPLENNVSSNIEITFKEINVR